VLEVCNYVVSWKILWYASVNLFSVWHTVNSTLTFFIKYWTQEVHHILDPIYIFLWKVFLINVLMLIFLFLPLLSYSIHPSSYCFMPFRNFPFSQFSVYCNKHNLHFTLTHRFLCFTNFNSVIFFCSWSVQFHYFRVPHDTKQSIQLNFGDCSIIELTHYTSEITLRLLMSYIWSTYSWCF